MKHVLPTTLAAGLLAITPPHADAGYLYGINLGTGGGADTENLYRVDLSDNSVTAIGPDNDVFQGIQSLAYNPVDHVLYGYDIVNDDLVVINPDTAAIQATIPITGFLAADVNCFALGYDHNTGILWGINTSLTTPGAVGKRSLMRIDPVTGAAALVGDGFEPANAFNLSSADFDPNSGTFYGVSGGNDDNLYSISTTTGDLSLIGNYATNGNNGSLGLAFDYDNDVLYGFEDNGNSGTDRIVTVDATTGASTVVNGPSFPNTSNIRGLAFVGTPTSPASLEITGVTREGDGQITLTWNSAPGETYTVRWSTDLVDFSGDVTDNLGSGGETTTFTFPNPTVSEGSPDGAPELFLRVEENP